MFAFDPALSVKGSLDATFAASGFPADSAGFRSARIDGGSSSPVLMMPRSDDARAFEPGSMVRDAICIAID